MRDDILIRRNDVEELIRSSDVLKHLSWDEINKLIDEIKKISPAETTKCNDCNCERDAKWNT